MHLKDKLVFLVGLFLVNVSFGQDPVQKDIINYMNVGLSKIAPLETEALQAYSAVSGTNYTTDDLMYKKMKEEVLPSYKKFSKKLKAIKPATKELKKIHQEYVNASTLQLQAFTLIADAIKKQDNAELLKANDNLATAATLIASWKKDFLALCATYNVVFDGTW